MRTKAITSAVGTRIRTLRKRQKLSTEKLAELADLDMTYLGGIERGSRNPTLEVLSRIAKALRIELAALLDPHEGEAQETLRTRVAARVKVMKPDELRQLLRILDAMR